MGRNGRYRMKKCKDKAGERANGVFELRSIHPEPGSKIKVSRKQDLLSLTLLPTQGAVSSPSSCSSASPGRPEPFRNSKKT